MLNTADGDTPGAKRCKSRRKMEMREQNSGLVFPLFDHDNPLSLFLHPTLRPYPKE